MTPTAAQISRYKELLRHKWDCSDTPNPCTDGLPHAGLPFRHSRLSQRVPHTDDGGSYIHAWVTGRGFGKSRAAAEYIKMRMLSEPNHRVTVIAQTFGHGRDLTVEGESGLLAVLPPNYLKNWNRSLGELALKNGSQLKIFGSHTTDDAEAIRGSQSNTVWAEEVAYWRQAQLAWNNAMMANRLGHDPRVVVTATPRNTALMRYFFAENKKNPQFVHIQGGSTFENQDNLAPAMVAHLIRTYQGSRLGSQELEGIMLDDVVGALFSRDYFRYTALTDELLASLTRIVVAVDPPGGHRPGLNAECGIVAVGLSEDRILYVLNDSSGYYSPDAWASKAIQLYDSLNADCIVAEQNYGGEMVRSTLRSYSAHPRFKMVQASRGKVLRAEPVVSLYETGRVYHAGTFKELETQQTSWVPAGQVERDEHGIETQIPSSPWSPDRVDALVHACTELALLPTRTTSIMTCPRPSRPTSLSGRYR